MKSFCPIFIFIFFLISFTAGADTATVDIREWHVPWEKSRPRDPYVDQKGRIWFCGQAGRYIAYFDPKSEQFKKYDLDEGSAPHNLIVDREGFVWFAENAGGYIGKLDPETGDIRKFPMPDPEVTDPHTLAFDSKGDIWFTAQLSNIVGKLSVKTGEIKLIPVTTEDARPYGIKVDSRDRPWIVLFGTNKLATVDPETFKLKEYELPRKEIRPRRLAITSSDKIWIVDYATGRLGRFDPVAESYIERRMPGGDNAEPYAMTVDDKDRLWFVETGLNPNRLIGFSPWTKEFSHIADIPSGGRTVRHMYYHPATREIWFGTDTNFIGRAIVPE
ncbi:MAG: lyase [Gammaproteobacteria bacterium]|nr:lyase [Gammaproteobacteria bacterium]